jgi:hypothetical protein
MAFTLKKHITGQKESTRLDDVNDNWAAIEQESAAIRSVIEETAGGGYPIFEHLDEIEAAETARVSAETARQTNTAAAIASTEAATAAANNDRLWRLAESESGIVSDIYPVPESEMYPKIALTYSQAGSGDPSPSNIRAISGVGSVSLKRTGKNFAQLEQGTINPSNGILVPSATRVRTQKISVIPDATHTVNYYQNWSFRNAAYYDKNGDFLRVDTAGFNPPVSGGTKTFAIPSDVYFVIIVVSAMDGNLEVTPSYCNFQLELGSTATTYDPYSGASNSLTLPETLYGGVVDFETGKVKKEWAYVEFDGTESWSKYTVTHPGVTVFYYAGLVGKKAEPFTRPSRPIVVSHYRFKREVWQAANQEHGSFSDHTLYASTIYLCHNNADLGCQDSDSDEVKINAWKSYLAAQAAAGTPVAVCYKLATPVETDLTLPTVTALAQLNRYTPRQNVVTSSEGTLSVGYAKSPIRESNEVRALIV